MAIDENPTISKVDEAAAGYLAAFTIGVLHGDAEHRCWLLEEARQFIEEYIPSAKAVESLNKVLEIYEKL